MDQDMREVTQELYDSIFASLIRSIDKERSSRDEQDFTTSNKEMARQNLLTSISTALRRAMVTNERPIIKCMTSHEFKVWCDGVDAYNSLVSTKPGEEIDKFLS